MPQESTILVKVRSVLTSALDLAAAKSELAYDKLLSLVDGTGADQANQVWHDTRTLTSGASETLDVNGSLTNAVGASVTFTKVKAIIIKNKGTTDLTVGGAATNAFASFVGAAAHTIKVPAGGILVLTAPGAAGFAVTAGTGDALQIANAAGASCDYDIVLIGVN